MKDFLRTYCTRIVRRTKRQIKRLYLKANKKIKNFSLSEEDTQAFFLWLSGHKQYDEKSQKKLNKVKKLFTVILVLIVLIYMSAQYRKEHGSEAAQQIQTLESQLETVDWTGLNGAYDSTPIPEDNETPPRLGESQLSFTG